MSDLNLIYLEMYMPEAIFNGNTKTIRIDKCGTYNGILKTCRDKFRTKHIKHILKDGQILNCENVHDIDKNTIFRCYTASEFKKISSKDKQKLQKNDEKISKKKSIEIIDLSQQSKIPLTVTKRLEYISSLPEIKEIKIYPNISECKLFPKGSVVVSNSIYPSIGLRIGRGVTVYLVEQIEPKLKKLKSLCCNLYDGYLEVHKITEYYSDEYIKFNYIVLARISKNKESCELINNVIREDSSSLIYGIEKKKNDIILSKIKQLEEKIKRLRDISCKKVLKKLNINNGVKVIEQTENSVYFEKDSFYTLTNVIDCRDSQINIITGSRNSPSYIVKPLTNFLPSGSGRRIDYFNTMELAKLDVGFLNGEIRNKNLICKPDDDITIYQKYYKGYKNIERTIIDLEKMSLAKKILKTEPILTYKM